MNDKPQEILVMKLVKEAILPKRMTSESAGYDLHSIQDSIIKSGSYKVIKTGLAFEIPNGMEAQVRPRSGLAAKHGVTVLNSPGTIDSDFRGEISVILINHGIKEFVITAGDRIAQLVFSKITDTKLTEVEKISTSVRGSGGFGSTGVRSSG